MDYKEIINMAVEKIINNSISEKKLDKLRKDHKEKVHFIPQRYRVLGGTLQSMNIQYGNFIEVLMKSIVENDGKYEIISEFSGKKSNKFVISKSNEETIDAYISKCETLDIVSLPERFKNLITELNTSDNDNLKSINHDIDLLFKNKNTGKYYYLEIKYNDDHDTGKFVDINRKFIKTYAYLLRKLKEGNLISEKSDLVPIIFYFSNRKRYHNIFVPESTNIRRGHQLFDELFDLKFEKVDSYLKNLSESDKNIQKFNEIYNKIVNDS